MRRLRAPNWDYSSNAADEYGELYKGRRLIGRDDQIHGGVYHGLYEGEAIVVDPVNNPDWYKRLVDTSLLLARGISELPPHFGGISSGLLRPSVNSELRILYAIYLAVEEALTTTSEGVANVLNRWGKKDGDKVELSVFMHYNVGVCRHQGLAHAAIAEQLVMRGDLSGQVSIDRNRNGGPRGTGGGHSWSRYNCVNGLVVISDIAQDYFGPLESPPRDGRWDYRRPDELQVGRVLDGLGPG